MIIYKNLLSRLLVGNLPETCNPSQYTVNVSGPCGLRENIYKRSIGFCENTLFWDARNQRLPFLRLHHSCVDREIHAVAQSLLKLAHVPRKPMKNYPARIV